MKATYLSFIFLMFAYQMSEAQDSIRTRYVGIPTEKFNYYYAEQNRSQWCWAASIQMILNYYGINISQEEIVRRSFGTDPYGELPDWASSLETITLNLNNWSIDNRGVSYIVNSILYQYAPEPAIFVDELKNQYPVLLAYHSSKSTGHAVLATGLSYAVSDTNLTIYSIIVRDPSPSEKNRLSNGRVEYSGIDLASLIYAHWYIRVKRIN